MSTKHRALKVLSEADGHITVAELAVRAGLTLKQTHRALETISKTSELESHYLPLARSTGKPQKAYKLAHKPPVEKNLPLGHSQLEIAKAHKGNPFAWLLAGHSAIDCNKEPEYDNHD